MKFKLIASTSRLSVLNVMVITVMVADMFWSGPIKLSYNIRSELDALLLLSVTQSEIDCKPLPPSRGHSQHHLVSQQPSVH